MIRNMIRASALDLEFFNRAERSSGMTLQALAVVVLAEHARRRRIMDRLREHSG